jgi:hypothetical protein
MRGLGLIRAAYSTVMRLGNRFGKRRPSGAQIIAMPPLTCSVAPVT